VKAGLTACDIVSKWTWAATLLQSSNVAYKYGVAGPFWYASGELSWAAATAAARIFCCQDPRDLKVPTGRYPALLILHCLTTRIFVVGTVLHPGPAASVRCMLDVAISHLIGAVCVWCMSGATIQVLLFAIMAVEIKRKAPTCHTVLEVVRVSCQ